MKNRKRNTTKKTKTTAASNQVRGTTAAPAAFEALENRQLMATVNVADFGAIANDGRDDRGAIQNAINASAQGDTINFGKGEYTIGDTIDLASDRNYIGNDTTLKWSSGDTGHMARAVGKNDILFKGFVANGAGFKFENTENLTFTQNTVKNVTTGHAWHGNGVLITESMRNGRITHNFFDNIGHRGVYFFNVTETKVEDNLFERTAQAISGSFHTTSRNASFSYNTVRDSKRHGIELQNYGDTENLLVEGNLLERWGDGRPSWNSHMALSIAMGGNARNTIIRGNVMIADGSIPDKLADGVPLFYFTAIEAMGKNFTIENNYAEGWGWYQLVGNNDGVWTTRNNVWLGANGISVKPGKGAAPGQEIVPEHGFSGGPTLNEGNYYGKKGDRPRPTAGVRNGSQNPNPTPAPTPTPTPTPTPNPTPSPAPTPSPDAVKAPTRLAGKATSTSTIELTWNDVSNNETGFEVQRKTTRGSDDWATVTTLEAGTTSFTDKGLVRTWEYDYRIVAIGKDGSRSTSPVITVQTMRGESTKPVVSGENTGGLRGAPNAVTRFVGYPLSNSQIRMIWADTNRNETGYRVERKTTRGSDGWIEVATLPAGSKVFVDKKLTQNWEYDYRIVAINPVGETVSSVITVKTLKRDMAVGSKRAVHLNNLKWTKALGEVDLNADAEGGNLAIGEQGYYRGLGVAANSQLRFRLDGKYQTFTSDIGLDNAAGRDASVVFEVWADGKMLFDSGTIRAGELARTVTVPVQGKQELWLVVTNAGDAGENELANWANARLAA